MGCITIRTHNFRTCRCDRLREFSSIKSPPQTVLDGIQTSSHIVTIEPNENTIHFFPKKSIYFIKECNLSIDSVFLQNYCVKLQRSLQVNNGVFIKSSQRKPYKSSANLGPWIISYAVV